MTELLEDKGLLESTESALRNLQQVQDTVQLEIAYLSKLLSLMRPSEVQPSTESQEVIKVKHSAKLVSMTGNKSRGKAA